MAGVLTAVCDHARRLKLFAAVHDSEPKGALDPTGVTLAVWAGPVDPVPQLSGLNSTAVRLELGTRVYRSMLAKPETDTIITGAVDALLRSLSADFTLGGQVIAVDLLGGYGAAPASVPGYVEMDHKVYRIIDTSVPLLIDNLWPHAP